MARARSAEDRAGSAAQRGRRRGAARRTRGADAGSGRRRRPGRPAGPLPGRGVRARDPVQPVSELEFRVAIRDALAEELERDPTVVFFGEDVAAAGGVFKATPDLLARFGPERVFDTPISELALAGAAYGAAVTGLRPVIEVMFG